MKRGEKIKNIVLITVDSLRYDHSKIIKEKMMEVLGKGIDFEEAYSTGPSSISSYIGYLASKYSTFPDEKYFIMKPKLKRKRILLFEILKKAGYKTYVIANNSFHEMYGYDDGVDVLITKINKSNDNKYGEIKSLSIKLRLLNKFVELIKRITSFSRKEENNTPHYTAKEITSIVKEIIKKNHETNKMFIQINYLDTHTPLNTSNKYIRKYMNKDQIINSKLGFKEIYEIRELMDTVESNSVESQKLNDKLESYEKLYYYETLYLAEHIKKLMKYLKRNGMVKNSLFILHSDHGEYIKPEGKLLGHGHPVINKEEALNVFFNNLVHIPLTIWGVGQKNVKKLVSLIDLAPTILEIIGLDKPTEWYGDSLFSEKEKPIISEDVRHGYKCYAVRTKDWVFAYNSDINQEYLFKRFPEDKQNLSFQRKDVVNHMKELYKIHNKKIQNCWKEYLKKDLIKIISKMKTVTV